MQRSWAYPALAGRADHHPAAWTACPSKRGRPTARMVENLPVSSPTTRPASACWRPAGRSSPTPAWPVSGGACSRDLAEDYRHTSQTTRQVIVRVSVTRRASRQAALSHVRLWRWSTELKATYITSSPLTGECPECGKVVKVKLGRTGRKDPCYLLRRHGSCPGGEQEPRQGQCEAAHDRKEEGRERADRLRRHVRVRPEKALRNLVYRTSRRSSTGVPLSPTGGSDVVFLRRVHTYLILPIGAERAVEESVSRVALASSEGRAAGALLTVILARLNAGSPGGWQLCVRCRQRSDLMPMRRSKMRPSVCGLSLPGSGF
jgi:hypothetical protein